MDSQYDPDLEARAVVKLAVAADTPGGGSSRAIRSARSLKSA
jgi:hypothetical protein